jgi:hypothetical protein
MVGAKVVNVLVVHGRPKVLAEELDQLQVVFEAWLVLGYPARGHTITTTSQQHQHQPASQPASSKRCLDKRTRMLRQTEHTPHVTHLIKKHYVLIKKYLMH